MVLVEDLAGANEIELVLGLRGPRQVREPLEVGADHVAVGSVGGQGAQPAQLALGLLLGLFGQLRRLDLLAQLVGFALAAVALAQLVLDVAHSPTQQLLALLRIHLPVCIAREGLLGLRDGRFPLEVGDETPEPVGRVGLLEERDHLFDRQPQIGRDQVCEEPRRGEVGEALLPLVGYVVAELDDPVREREHLVPGPRSLGGGLARLGQRIDARDDRTVLFVEGDQPRSDHSPHDGLLALARRVDHARHSRQAGDGVELGEAGLLELGVELGRDEEEAARPGAVERGERSRPADDQGHRHSRQDRCTAYGQQRHPRGNLHRLAACSNDPNVLRFRHGTSKGAPYAREKRGQPARAPKSGLDSPFCASAWTVPGWRNW